MAGLDWNAIEAEATANNFKQYANNGEHTVKVASIEGKDNGSGWFEMQFEESDVKYPKLSVAFFGDGKVNFRAHYYKEIMKLLGASEENARKAVEACEGKSSRDEVFKTYVDAFSRLAKKHPQIKIEVRDQYDRNGQPVRSAQGTIYGESVFTKDSGLQFKSNGASSADAQSENSDPLAGAEKVDLSEEEFPFN